MFKIVDHSRFAAIRPKQAVLVGEGRNSTRGGDDGVSEEVGIKTSEGEGNRVKIM